MIGSKMVLTYKRKRLSSRFDIAFENECRNSSSGCQTLEVLTTSVKQEEDSKLGHKPESERKDLENDSLLSQQAKETGSLKDAMKDTKSGSPLITFSRRSRQKRTVNGTSSIVPEEYGAEAAKPVDGCSPDLKENDPDSRYCAGSHQKKTSEDVDLHRVHHSLSVAETEIEKLAEGGCILKEDPPIIGKWESTDANTAAGASFDLSKPPPPESSNMTTLGESFSADSTTTSHYSHELPRLMELLHDRIGEKTWLDFADFPPQNRNFLQLFPESNIEKCSRSGKKWSEEELDFLWMGVRRHGMGKWEGMLRDRRLQFAPWRSARDLADRWDHELTHLNFS